MHNYQIDETTSMRFFIVSSEVWYLSFRYAMLNILRENFSTHNDPTYFEYEKIN